MTSASLIRRDKAEFSEKVKKILTKKDAYIDRK